MTQTYSLLRSKTFYTVVLMALIGAGNAVVPIIAPNYAAVLVVVLGAIASIFHLSTGLSTSGTN